MIFGLIMLGLLLIAVALKGTERELGQLIQSDMLGQDGFIVWIFAILALGAVGYIPGLETTSNYLLALLMTVVLLRNGGVWSQLRIALQEASAAGPAPSTIPPSGSSSGSSGGSASSGGGNSAASTVATVATIAALALA